MPDNWTYIVEDPRRSELLREWGVPELIISLGSGSVPDEVFEFNCQKPKHVFSDEETSDKELVVGVYESKYDEAFACRRQGDGVEFVCFNVKRPTDVQVYGASPQCLLRALFDEIVESEYYKRDDIERAAKNIGFDYLADTYAFIFGERKLTMYDPRKRDIKAYHKRRLKYIRGIYRPGLADPYI